MLRPSPVLPDRIAHHFFPPKCSIKMSGQIKKTKESNRIAKDYKSAISHHTAREERTWQLLHLAARDEALQAGANVTLTGGNFEVAVDNTRLELVIMKLTWHIWGWRLTSRQAGYRYRCQGHREGQRRRKEHQCRHHRRRPQWG